MCNYCVLGRTQGRGTFQIKFLVGKGHGEWDILFKSSRSTNRCRQSTNDFLKDKKCLNTVVKKVKTRYSIVCGFSLFGLHSWNWRKQTMEKKSIWWGSFENDPNEMNWRRVIDWTFLWLMFKKCFQNFKRNTFWINAKTTYPQLSELALREIIRFTTSYLCERSFSVLLPSCLVIISSWTTLNNFFSLYCVLV